MPTMSKKAVIVLCILEKYKSCRESNVGMAFIVDNNGMGIAWLCLATTVYVVYLFCMTSAA